MKVVITSLLAAAALGLGACASSPVAGIGSEMKATAGVYGDYSKAWEKAAKDEQKALDLVEDGEKRVAKGEKLIREARKDTRRGEEMIERGESEVRQGVRDAASAKDKRLEIEQAYKDAVRTDDERAAEGAVTS